jgi:hypothetical protein
MPSKTPRQLRLTAYRSIRHAARLLRDAAFELEQADDLQGADNGIEHGSAYRLHRDALRLRDRLAPQRRARKAVK